MKKLADTKHSMTMMWGCAALVALAVIVALATGPSVLLFVIPCIAMMGAMVWMMTGGSTRGGQQS